MRSTSSDWVTAVCPNQKLAPSVLDFLFFLLLLFFSLGTNVHHRLTGYKRWTRIPFKSVYSYDKNQTKIYNMLISHTDSELNCIYSRGDRLVRATASLKQGWKEGFGRAESAMTKQDIVKSTEGPILGSSGDTSLAESRRTHLVRWTGRRRVNVGLRNQTWFICDTVRETEVRQVPEKE